MDRVGCYWAGTKHLLRQVLFYAMQGGFAPGGIDFSTEYAPKRTGKYAKSWSTKKTKENSHSLEMTVHSKNRYQLAHLLEKGYAKRGGGRV